MRGRRQGQRAQPATGRGGVAKPVARRPRSAGEGGEGEGRGNAGRPSSAAAAPELTCPPAASTEPAPLTAALFSGHVRSPAASVPGWFRGSGLGIPATPNERGSPPPPDGRPQWDSTPYLPETALPRHLRDRLRAEERAAEDAAALEAQEARAPISPGRRAARCERLYTDAALRQRRLAQRQRNAWEREKARMHLSLPGAASHRDDGLLDSSARQQHADSHVPRHERLYAAAERRQQRLEEQRAAEERRAREEAARRRRVKPEEQQARAERLYGDAEKREAHRQELERQVLATASFSPEISGPARQVRRRFVCARAALCQPRVAPMPVV